MFLLAYDIGEFNLVAAVRALLVTILAAIFILLLLRLVMKEWHRAVVFSSVVLILLLSYGRLCNYLDSIDPWVYNFPGIGIY